MASPAPTNKSVRIGVMLENVQMSDIIGIDIFGNISTQYVQVVSDEFAHALGGSGVSPEAFGAIKAAAIDLKIYWISSSLEPAPMTPEMRFMPNVTYDDCPRDLDIVLIGGPPPSHRPAAADEFMKEAWESTRVWMTTCVGSVWLASAGLLDGKKCTTNRMFLPMAANHYPKTEWLDQRWVVDEKSYAGEGKGELWTAGGAGAGKCGIRWASMLNHGAMANLVLQALT
jgi:putative intracellular protease/amidase